MDPRVNSKLLRRDGGCQVTVVRLFVVASAAHAIRDQWKRTRN